MAGPGRGGGRRAGQAGPDARCFSSSSNLNINDVLGNYSLTLIDALDTLAVSPHAGGASQACPGREELGAAGRGPVRGSGPAGWGCSALLAWEAPELLPRSVQLNLIRREVREVCVGSWNEQTEFRKLV